MSMDEAFERYIGGPLRQTEFPTLRADKEKLIVYVGFFPGYSDGSALGTIIAVSKSKEKVEAACFREAVSSILPLITIQEFDLSDE